MPDTTKGYHSFPSGAAERQPRSLVDRAVLGIFLIMLFYFVAEARTFLMPAMLAFLLFFVFVPFTRFLARRGIGKSAAAGIVTGGLLLTTVGLGYVVSTPVSYLIENSDSIGARIEQRLGSLRENFRGLEEAAAKLDQISTGGDATDAPADAVATAQSPDGATTTTVAQAANGGTTTRTTTITPGPEDQGPTVTQQDIHVSVQSSDGPSTLQQAALLGPEVLGQIVFTLVLLFFLISSGDLMYLKIVQSFDRMRDKRAAYIALREIEDSLGTYLGAITIVNAGLGVSIGLAMWAWGMPSPVLWGVAGFILNYIPYIGAIIGVSSAILVGLMIHDDLWTPILIGMTFLALTSLEGQFITPQFVSRRLRLNEVVVFLTVALWAWLWSIIGMVVAVPVLVVIRVLAQHIPGWEKFGNFLGGEDPPALEDEDEEQARDLVETGAEAEDADEARDATAPLEEPPPPDGVDGMGSCCDAGAMNRKGE